MPKKFVVGGGNDHICLPEQPPVRLKIGVADVDELRGRQVGQGSVEGGRPFAILLPTQCQPERDTGLGHHATPQKTPRVLSYSQRWFHKIRGDWRLEVEIQSISQSPNLPIS